MNCLLYFIIIFGVWVFHFLIYLHLDHTWLLPSYKYSNFVKSLSESNKEYDYIIVGAGSAGSVIAHRLSQNTSLKVLLIEAGPVGSPILDVPGASALLQLSAVDWQYKTTSQTHAALSLNEQRSNWPRGKLVGGSGRLNNMMYVRGHPEDYVNWFPADWKLQSFHEQEEFLKYYWKRSEDQQGRYRNNTDSHGTKGPLIASDLEFTTKLSTLIESASLDLNISKRDVNTYYTGFDIPQVNLKNGARYSTGHFLLDQLNVKPNLHLVTQAEVVKVQLVYDYEASSVIAISKNGNTKYEMEIFARHGIIISAGAINTAKLLQLSGIGDSKHLESVGIRTSVELPEVGMNLQDHIGAGLDMLTLNETLELNAYTLINPMTLYNYVMHGKGPLTTVECEGMVIGHIDCLLSQIRNDSDFASCDANRKLRAPDFQLLVLPLGITTDLGAHLYKTIGINWAIYKNHFEYIYGKPTVLMLPLALHPKSTGYVRIKSSDPRQPPLVNPKYLTHPDDIEIMLKGMRFIQELVKTPSMQKLGTKIDDRSYPSCQHYRFDSDEYWRCYIRQTTLTIYHPVGTAALGKVLDYNFRVKGTNKLFVADASTLPGLSSGNPNAVVVVAAELASDYIKHELVLSTGICHIIEVFNVVKFNLFFV